MQGRKSDAKSLLDCRVRITNGDDVGRTGYVERVEHADEIHVWLDPADRPFRPAAHVCVGVGELEVIW